MKSKAEYLKVRDRSYGQDCTCCGGINQPYMVKNSLWKEVFPKGLKPESRYRRNHETDKLELVSGTGFFVCIACFESRLGRDLIVDDFSDAPINFGIFGFDCRVYCALPRKEAA